MKTGTFENLLSIFCFFGGVYLIAKGINHFNHYAMLMWLGSVGIYMGVHSSK